MFFSGVEGSRRQHRLVIGAGQYILVTVQYSTVITDRRRIACRSFAFSRHHTYALPASHHHTYALPASRHQTGSFLLTVRRRPSGDNSPAVEHGPPFAASRHRMHPQSSSIQMYWTIDARCSCCRWSIGGQPKNHRRYGDKGMKIRGRRKKYWCVIMSSCGCVHGATMSRLQRRAADFHNNLMFAQTILCCLRDLRYVYNFADMHTSSTVLCHRLQSVLPCVCTVSIP